MSECHNSAIRSHENITTWVMVGDSGKSVGDLRHSSVLTALGTFDSELFVGVTQREGERERDSCKAYLNIKEVVITI